MKKPTKDEIKIKLFSWIDYYGQDIVDTERIKKAKTRKDLREIVDAHIHFLELQNIDAITHAENFKKSLGL